jgi:transposase-like protein
MSNEQETNSDQQQFWQMVLETFKTSTLSVRQFCKQEGLTEPTFYAWRKKLAENNESAKGQKKDLPSQSFIEVAMPREDASFLELILASGNSLRIPHGIESKTLTDVISALSKAGLC